MLSNELEYRHARKKLEALRSEVEKRSLAVERETSQTVRAVIEALKMKIGDIKREIADYEDLKNGKLSEFEADSLDEFGELVTKARIAKGWSQADLAEAVGIHSQQIQRYERNDWQKINLWRLQEIVEILRLRLNIHAHLEDVTEGRGATWPRAEFVPYDSIDVKADTVSEKGQNALNKSAAASGQSIAEPVMVS
jgi:HTH-type transcriptional regulator/antitoxin HigA